jgi:hypothetical protein
MQHSIKNIFTFLLSLFLTPAFALAGGGSDGGSCGIYKDQNWLLKDFNRANYSIMDSHNLGAKITLGPVSRFLGFEMLNGKYQTVNLRQLSVFKQAVGRLRAWQKDSPELAQMIEQALEQIEFAGTNVVIKPLAYGCEQENDYPAIIYVNQFNIALISVPVWNSLTYDSQIGSFYKEALRFLQKELQKEIFSGEGLVTRSENLLSELVSTLVFGKPKNNAHTVNQVFLKHGYNLSLASLGFTSVHSETKKLCKEALKVFSQMQASSKAEYLCKNDSIENDLASLTEIRRTITDLEGEIENRQLKNIASKSANLMDQLIAMRLRARLESPEVRASLTKLKGVTESLNYCAQTTVGSKCQTKGWGNIDIISEKIYEASKRNIFEPRLKQQIEILRNKLQEISRKSE